MSETLSNWELILKALDEKSQLGLITYLRRCTEHNLSEEILYLTVASKEDFDYLSRSTVQNQIKLISDTYVRIKEIRVVQG